MESKELNVLELFFESPTRQWHFEELVKQTKLARSKLNKWLTIFIKTNLIQKLKEKGKMPYYKGNYTAPEYKNKKKLFALNQLYESGLLNYLDSLKNIHTVIIFGSYIRSDWVKDSDIDIFMYGDPKRLKIAPYELKLKREIQLFTYKNKKELKTLNTSLLKNILKGIIIKGDLDFLEVKVHA